MATSAAPICAGTSLQTTTAPSLAASVAAMRPLDSRMSLESFRPGRGSPLPPTIVDRAGLMRAERIAQRSRLRWRIKVAFQFRHIWPDRAQTNADIRNLITACRSLPG